MVVDQLKSTKSQMECVQLAQLEHILTMREPHVKLRVGALK